LIDARETKIRASCTQLLMTGPFNEFSAVRSSLRANRVRSGQTWFIHGENINEKKKSTETNAFST
jgi:hypothetical protein